jgi:hypothetical protein
MNLVLTCKNFTKNALIIEKKIINLNSKVILQQKNLS